MAQLVFVDGRNMGRALPVSPGTTIGSARDNTLWLSDPGVLPRHAVVRRGESGWIIARAEPLARISVNGREAAEHPLRHGDVVSLATVALFFSDEPAQAPDEEVRILARAPALSEPQASLPVLQLSAFADRLLAQLVAAFQPDRCFLLVADEEGRLQVRTERGTAGRPPRTLAGTGALEALLAEEGRGPEARSALFAPFCRDGRRLGAVVLEVAASRRRYGEDDLARLNAAAALAAGPLQGVLALERESSQRRALVRLADAARRLSGNVSRGAVARAAIEEACAFFECTKASLMLVDPRGGHLAVVESNCIDRALWPSVKLRPGEGFAGRVLMEGKALLVTDARGPRSYETASFAIAPVISRGDGASPSVAGVLSVTDKRSQASFTPEDLERLSILAAQAGTALDNARLFERTTLDPLTRAWTRQYFDCRMEDLVAAVAGGREPLAVLLVDIDHLKDKNDVYGRKAGDSILAEGAGLMELQLNRTADLVARYAGEQFAAALPGVDAAEARGLAEDVRRAIEEHPFNMEDEPIRATVSVGVAGLKPGDTPAALMKRAEEALATAKRNGRNRVEVGT